MQVTTTNSTAATGATPSQKAQLQKAAQQFEAVFLR